MESRTKNSIRNITTGIINKIINILLPFIVRTIFIQKLGAEFLGLNSLFTSILQVLNLTELGFSSAMIYSMYKPLANNDEKKVNILLNYYKKCYRIIGIIILIIGIVICPFISIFIKEEIPNVNIYLAFIIYLVNTVISYLFFAYRESILIASQRNDLSSKINIIICILQNSIQLIILFLLNNYYAYIIILPIMTLLRNIFVYYTSKKYFPKNYPEGILSEKECRDIKKNVKGMIFQKIGYIVLANADTIVISSFLGLDVLGIYNNYYYVVTAIIGIINIIMDSLKSSVGNSIVLESVEKNYKDFKFLNFVYIWIVTWCSICLLCLLHNFIYIWLGTAYTLEKNISLFLGVYFFIYKWCDMTYVYQEAKGLWWENRYIPITGALLNLILNLILVNYIGLYGIICSTIISLLSINNIGFAYILFRYYFKNKDYLIEYFKNQVKYIVVFIIVSYVTYILCSLLGKDILSFVIKVFICITIPNILLLLIYNKNDNFIQSKKFIKQILLKKELKNE